MLINGNKASTNTNEILSKLELLPSSFPNYKNTTSIGPLSSMEHQSYTEAIQLYNTASQEFTVGNAKNVLKRLESIEQVFSADKILLSFANSLMAESYRQLGQFDKAAEKFQNAAQASLEVKQYYNAENIYKSLAGSHGQNNTLNKYQKTLENNLLNRQADNDQQSELSNRLALGAVYRIQGNQDAAIEQYSAAYSLQQGKVDQEAYRVEQREVGFSNQEKIGTDNIQQCVAVIIYDPESKKTALAHVDRFTDPTSLSKDVIDKFPKDKKLEAYLVGGRDRNPQSIDVSDGNIRKVTEILKQYNNIDIKAADIGNKEIPSGIVFDPATGKLEHAVPGKEGKSNVLRQVRINLFESPQDNNYKLNYAFDLTESKDIPVPNLSKEQQKEVVQMWYNQKASTMPTFESWQANQISNPLNKVVEEIRKTNPKIVESILKEDIDKLGLSESKKQELTNKTIESISDNNKPAPKIHKEISNAMWHKTIKAKHKKIHRYR